MKGCFFLVAAGFWLVLAGCGRQAPPTVDMLHSQLLRDAGEAMLSGDVARSRQALQRLRDAAPADAFAVAAGERLEYAAAMAQVNADLRAGRIDAAARQVRAATGGAFRAATEAGPTVAALVAFQAYLAQRPFSTSETAEAALRELNSHRPVLERAAEFLTFIHAETTAIAGLRRRELDRVVDGLVADLDRAAVSGTPAADPHLVHLIALRPAHMLVRAWAAAAVADAAALRRLGAEAVADPATRRDFEVGVALVWQGLSAAAWQATAAILVHGQPASLSGLLLQTAAAAAADDAELAARTLHSLAAASTVDPRHVAWLLRHYVLTPQQAQAWCWRNPAPGVADVLGCIVQLRTSRPR